MTISCMTGEFDLSSIPVGSAVVVVPIRGESIEARNIGIITQHMDEDEKTVIAWNDRREVIPWEDLRDDFAIAVFDNYVKYGNHFYEALDRFDLEKRDVLFLSECHHEIDDMDVISCSEILTDVLVDNYRDFVYSDRIDVRDVPLNFLNILNAIEEPSKMEEVKTTPSPLSSKPKKQKKEKKPKSDESEERIETMPESKYEVIMSNTKDAVAASKDFIIQAQKGAITIAAAKAAISESPLPEKLKEIIDTPVWGDYVAAMLLDIVIPTVCEAKEAAEITRSANMVASTALSVNFSWLQDMAKNVIKKTRLVGGTIVDAAAAKE